MATVGCGSTSATSNAPTATPSSSAPTPLGDSTQSIDPYALPDADVEALASSGCGQLKQALTDGKKALSRESQILKEDQLSDTPEGAQRWADDLTRLETWTGEYELFVQNALFEVIRSEADRQGIDAVAPAFSNYRAMNAIVANIMGECGLVSEWEAALDRGRTVKIQAQEAAGAARAVVSGGSKPASAATGSHGSEDEQTLDGVYFKWLKPGVYECNGLYDWCWGIKVTPVESCPNGLIVELDIFDAKTTKVDTAYDSLGSLRAGESGQLVFGTFVAAAKTAKVSSADCF